MTDDDCGISHREREERGAAMSDTPPGNASDEMQEVEEDSTDLSEEEEVDVEERRAPPAKIVHEVIRRQGIEELERPAMSLLWSGLAAGVVMGLSILAKALLSDAIPPGPSHDLFANFGYSVGFVIVIMGRLQLFTESTVSAILPLATSPSRYSLLRTARLWAIVFVANVVGTFLFAWFAWVGGFGGTIAEDMLKVSRVLFDHDVAATFTTGIPAGFLIATIVWMLPSASGQRVWIIILVTWLIALGGFAHVIAGSGEAWLLLLAGEMTLASVFGSFLLPALAGNIVGGTALFALLAHAQVSKEIHN